MMFIHFERSGGFMGAHLTADIETELLAPDEAHRLMDLIREADFFALPANFTEVEGAADQFQYLITITDEMQQHSVQVSDSSAPDTLHPLLRRLTRLARGQP
ncbi:MAG TPA: protealysin inhibitor emfourin [Aggregatilineaceae bacterium]|nr:protealysin inhibitor emfourin [Aggregatilineaceae bacterium]